LELGRSMLDTLRYGLHVESLDGELTAVTSFEAFEGLSELYEFRVEIAAAELLPFRDLTGKAATFSYLPPHGTERHVNGIIVGVEALGRIGGRLRYRVRICPRLAALELTRRSRIFQAKSTIDIVKAVLDEGKIDHRFGVHGSYGPREYCVQYGESDLAFVRRLLAEEGIFFLFEHTVERHVLVMLDDVAACPASSMVLPFRGELGAVTDDEHVSRFAAARRLRPGKVVLRDFNFLTPHADLTAQTLANADHDMEAYEHPGRYAAAADGGKVGKIRLEEQRRNIALFQAESDAAGLAPGVGFEIIEHPVLSLDGRYRVTEISHSGDDRLYRNWPTCIPAAHPWRPPRAIPRPLAAGVQTAVVVGPEGEEIHTDEHGRIKVQFHWDREGKSDDRSSCWMRVSQAWAGSGYGALFLPRVGHEVIVRFVDGDPDRPLVVGSVYNGANRPPVALPEHKTQSTLRSASSPGSEGWNELRIEDLAGREEVHVHAQKDEQIVVENDKQQEVRDGELLRVLKDRSREVAQNQTLTVDGNDSSLVMKNQTLNVGGQRTTRTSGDARESVKGSQTVTVTGLHTENVAEQSTEEVTTTKTLNVAGALVVAVGLEVMQKSGPREQSVGGSHEDWVGGDREETLGALELNVGGQLVIDVREGGLSVKVEKNSIGSVSGNETWQVKGESVCKADTVALEAEKLTFVVNGQKLLSMEKAGALTVAAQALYLDGTKITGKGKKIDIQSGAPPPAGQATPAKPDTLRSKDPKIPGSVSYEVANLLGEPAAGLDFRTTLPDGAVIEGSLSSLGDAFHLEVEDGDVKVEFPELAQDAWLPWPPPPLEPYDPEAARGAEEAEDDPISIVTTVALDAFKAVAQSRKEGGFVSWMILRFGGDISPEAYAKLHADLLAGKVQNPKHVIADALQLEDHDAAYDDEAKTILLDRRAVLAAFDRNRDAWRLLEKLLHEFGHYVDDLLRNQYSSRLRRSGTLPSKRGPSSRSRC
jgi:type VI secretion system secreted protein VgrG